MGHPLKSLILPLWLAVLAWPAAARAEDWDLVDNRPESSVYVDRDSIIVDGRIARMWTKSALRESALDPQTRRRYVREFVRWAFDCINKTALTTSWRHTAENGQVVSQNFIPAVPSRFEDVPPGSVTEIFMTIACKPRKTEQPVAEASTPAASESPTPAQPARPSFGTAWVAASGYVVTAYHVVRDAKKLTLAQDPDHLITATVAAADPTNDIAVLRPAWHGRAPRGLIVNAALPKLGAHVMTIGFPHPDVMGISPKLTSGEISSLTGIQDDPRLLQVSVPVQGGNSGGPLINMSGQAIGVVAAKLDAALLLKYTGDLTENANYAVKAAYVSVLLATLPPLNGGAGIQVKPGASTEDIAELTRKTIYLLFVE